MKRMGLFAALFLVAGHAYSAEGNCAAPGGCYEFIPYYNNDPFTFCTVGVPQDCWTPISAQLGTYTVTNQYCFNPISAQQFARVCPRAFQQGMDTPQAARDPADANQ